MRKHYLTLSVYVCEECKGPVVSGYTGVRENEISKESDIIELGSICLSCGHRQNLSAGLGVHRCLPPIQWEPKSAAEMVN